MDKIKAFGGLDFAVIEATTAELYDESLVDEQDIELEQFIARTVNTKSLK